MNQSPYLVAQVFLIAFMGSLTGAVFSFINSSILSIAMGTGIGSIARFRLNKYVFPYLANILLPQEIGFSSEFKCLKPMVFILALISTIAAYIFYLPFVKFVDAVEGYEPIFLSLSFTIVSIPC